MGRFDGKVAVITGASRGIGRAAAQRIADEGGKVVITARKPDPLAEAATALGGPDTALGIAGKAHDPDHRAEVIAQTLATFGRIDVLVNNTGINPVVGSVIDIDPAAMAKIYEVNVIAAASWAAAVHQAWMKENGGAIVNVSSLAGQHPAPGIGVYGTSKAALINLTQQLAFELAPAIRVNAVAPAVVKTDFATALVQSNEDELAATYPLGRLGVPEDVAAAIAFLASDDASWITGQTLTLDGGRTLSAGVS
ncbi:SDR family oxidoreductase [Nocardiopsis gilva YIM 90087]|uniref:SDR family oxidoreductase n=1 Tax=Nocardiopsis gilva YIM 90087 TaxID=1235441 RepID=A0A223S716_9ACTN|nr:SDR family oxidoreductase [Nocardiopsis gilva]ASU83903.1 SDR family oxidoreductase [Nocardiopsis gilva YIM 90087]